MPEGGTAAMLRLMALLILMLAVACTAGCDVRLVEAARKSTRTPKDKDDPWAMIEQEVDQRTARHLRRATEAEMRAKLKTVRTACELYWVENLEHPGFAERGWDDLLVGGYLREAPSNPLSPQDVGTQILVVDTPTTTGADVDPTTAGWVWNTGSNWGARMFAAGLRE